MAAIDHQSSSPWTEIRDRHLPPANHAPPAELHQCLIPGSIPSNSTIGMRRCRERPMRPSRRIGALAHLLESTSQLSSINGEGSSESPFAIPVIHTGSSNDETWKTRWQEIDLPYELAEVPDGTPQEICAIVKESINQSRAIRASLLEPKYEHRQPVTLTMSRENPSKKTELHTNESSVVSRERTGSSHSDTTASSPYSHRLSTGGQSFESFTSAESIPSLPLTPCVVPLSSNLCTNDAGPTKRPKRHGLFSKLLRGTELKMKSVALKSSTSVIEVVSETRECASCFDDVPSNDAVGLGCQHSYCSPCFTQLVTTAMQHENFWPPKCCLQDIPKGILEKNLSALELAKYSLKSREYAIPAGERWYCSRAECGKWFERSAARRRDVIVACTHCRFQMCLFCRGEEHAAGERCPQDRGLEATLAAADLEGWRRCYSCHTMVELNRGCRHITCTCGAQFCYTCGLRWRTCGCTEEDQIRRRDELAARRVIVNAEEAEVQAAIEAVAEAERREIEEAIEQERQQREIAEREERERVAQEEARLAKEMQRLERLEATRVEAITGHYAMLRAHLNTVHRAQRKAISARHTAEMGSTQHELEDIVSQEMAFLDDQKKDKSAWQERIHELRLRNAREIIQTLARHRADQDEYLTKFAEPSKEIAFDDIVKADMIEELAIIQESEREALRTKHQRDIRKLEARAADAQLVDLSVHKSALQQEKQAATQAIEQLKVRMYSDSKWLELVVRDRESLLGENEHQLISSGADAPISGQTASDSSNDSWPLSSQQCGSQHVEGSQSMQAAQVDWTMA